MNALRAIAVGILLAAFLYQLTISVNAAAENRTAKSFIHAGDRIHDGDMERDRGRLVRDIGRLRRDLRRRAVKAQIAKDRTLVRRDWLNIVIDRGKPLIEPPESTQNLA